MNFQTLKIEVGTHRVIKVISPESFPNEQLRELIQEKDEYKIIEYNSFSSIGNAESAFKKFCYRVTKTLDEVNTSRFDRIFLRFAVGMIPYGIVTGILYHLIATFGDFKETIQILNFSMPKIIAQAILCFFLLSIPVIFLFTKYGKSLINERLLKLKDVNKKYTNELSKHIEKDLDFNINDFNNLSKKWFKRDLQYLLIIHFTSWDIIQNKDYDINYLIVNLLDEHQNIKLLFTIEKDDNDYLSKLLENNDYQVNKSINLPKHQEPTMDYLEEVLKLKSKFPSLTDFTIKTIRSKKLNQLELSILYSSMLEAVKKKDLESINEFTEVFEKLEGGYDIKIIEDEKLRRVNFFFNTKNSWDTISADLKFFFFLVFYYHYFFNAPINKEIALKLSLISRKTKLRNSNENKIQDFQLIEEIITGNLNRTQPEYENIRKTIFNEFDLLGSIIDDSTNEIFRLDNQSGELVDWIVANKEKIYELDFHYLRNTSEFAKCFLLSTIFNDKTSLNLETFNKLLLYISPNEKFLFQSLVCHKFLKTSYNTDTLGITYHKGITIAQNIWENYEVENIIKFEFSIFDIGLDLINDLKKDPYYPLLELLKCSIEKIKNKQPEPIIQICEKLKFNLTLSENYTHSHLDFCNEFKAEKLKYNFFMDDYKLSEISNIEYLSLLHQVENNAFILLPLIEEDDLKDLPRIDLRKYTVFAHDNHSLDFLFLLILCEIHNNYYCNKTGEFLPLHSEKDNLSGNEIYSHFLKYEKELSNYSNSELNYRDYNYFLLYKAKGLILYLLLDRLGIEVSSKYFKETNLLHIQDFKHALSRFELFDNPFLIVDLLFWQSWLETRMSILGWKGVFKIDDKIKRILKLIEETLNYIHYDNGLIYIGVISNSAIPPFNSYQLIKNFLSKKEQIPRFIQFELLSVYNIITYNGQFDDRKKLEEECLKTIEMLITDFPDKISEDRLAKLEFEKLSILFKDLNNKKTEINNLFKSLSEKINKLSTSDKGLYYYRLLNFLNLENQYEEIRNSDYFEKAKRFLFEDKFYYIQFLRDSISHYIDIINAPKIEELKEIRKSLIEEYNKKVPIRNSALTRSGNLNQMSFLPEEEVRLFDNELNALKNQIDETYNKLFSMEMKDAQYEELEEELNNYIEYFNNTQAVYGESHPSKYLIANSSLVMARRVHNIFSIRNSKGVNYYRIALDLFFELKEFSPFLEIALELKFDKEISNSLKLKERVEKLTSLSSLSTYSKSKKEIEQISNLIYDFFNEKNLNNREDYTFILGVKDKIEKNIEGYRIDRDTRGFRKQLSLFYSSYFNEKNVISMLKYLKTAINYALSHIDEVTFDDIKTLEDLIDKTNEYSLSNTQWLEEINIQKERIEEIRLERGKLVQNRNRIY